MALLVTVLPAAALPGCADTSDASRIVISSTYPVDIDHSCDGKKWTASRVGPLAPLSLWIWNDGCGADWRSRIARIVTRTANGPIEKTYHLNFGQKYIVQFSPEDDLYVFRQITPTIPPTEGPS